MRADPDQVAQLRDRARVEAGLEAKYARAKPAAKPAPHISAEPTAEEKRAARLASGPPRGDGWRLEWATSPFTGQRFQYVVLDRELAPWAGLDDVLVDKGYRSRADLAQPVYAPTHQPAEVAF